MAARSSSSRISPSVSAILTWPLASKPQSEPVKLSMSCQISSDATESGISAGCRPSRRTPPALTPDACRPASFFSMTSTRRPRNARCSAEEHPCKPAPIMMTS